MSRMTSIGFAHRGGMAGAPENTLQAFRSALAQGVRGLESDVQLGSGGTPLLSHGPPQRGALALAELYEHCGTDYDLSLDVPDLLAARAVLGVALAAGHDPRRLWLCGRVPGLLAWRSLDPDVRLVSDARTYETVPGRTAYLNRLRHGGVAALNLRRGRWSAGLVRRVHARRLLAFAWDVQTEARLRAVIALGCDAVYSDHVDRLVRVLADAPTGHSR